MSAPDDANDLRGAYFKEFLGRPLTLGLIGLLMGAALIAGAVEGQIGAGAVAAGLALLAGVGVTFAIADRKAADAFFALYAEQREMTLIDERGRLPEATPLLRKGDDRYTERSLLGTLAGVPEGTLALYTYVDESTNTNGSKDKSYYRYTVGLLKVRECRDLVPELYCQRKFGFRALQGFEDVFRRSKERVELESEEMAKKYEVFARKGQDAIWLRRLFSPTFIVWLAEQAPERFAFEFVAGTLCCYVPGHAEDAAGLDAVAAATAAVATRLREEASE